MGIDEYQEYVSQLLCGWVGLDDGVQREILDAILYKSEGSGTPELDALVDALGER